ncbi:MAG TPA: restriction endonuclease subunit S [Verrucomicrobia subdivision 3 bacterium]|nr:restriction endonuclease subunit S [Limisphaerales bacterium]
MEVKHGYKQTEVGVIPEDWEVDQLGTIAFLERGKFTARPRNQPKFFGGDYSFIQTGDITNSNGNITTYTQTLNAEGLRVSKLFPRDTLFFTIAANIGDVGIAAFETAATDSVIAISPKPRIEKRWLYHSLKKRKKIFEGLATQNAQLNINLEKLRPYSLAVPPLAEQRAIAGALSDVDALLGVLDQLIAKKRDLKQAAMQQLLTGQTRLPGFHGEWAVKRLGDLFNFSGGYSASRDQLSNEGHCYLHYGDIHGATKTFVDARAEYQDIPKLNIPLKRVSSKSMLEDGDVVFVDASEDDEGTSRHVVVVNKDNIPFISGLHTIVAKSKTDELAHQFRRYCFQMSAIRQQFLFYAVGTKVSGISKTNIAKLTMPVPKAAEQTAIAEVLTDLDAELAALEQRRAKTRALKQGMMQELLTGRTRLV